jgi:hypothetical protein
MIDRLAVQSRQSVISQKSLLCDGSLLAELICCVQLLFAQPVCIPVSSKSIPTEELGISVDVSSNTSGFPLSFLSSSQFTKEVFCLSTTGTDCQSMFLSYLNHFFTMFDHSSIYMFIMLGYPAASPGLLRALKFSRAAEACHVA